MRDITARVIDCGGGETMSESIHIRRISEIQGRKSEIITSTSFLLLDFRDPCRITSFKQPWLTAQQTHRENIKSKTL